MADENKKHKKTERVMVHCRVRPLNDEDLRNYGKETIIDSVDQHRGTISLKREFDRKCFTFDSVFDGGSSQRDIFSKVAEPVVSSVLQGYNGTIFAYGQTGTGKTFTMIGSSGDNKGVIPRSISQIFLHIQQSPAHSFSVKIGFLQLYMEMLQDLLNPDDNKTIKIRENTDEGVYLTGVSWKTVNNVKQCMDWLSVGDRNRSTAFTSMNAHSSRSHAVYMVKIEKRVKYSPEQLEELEKKGDTPDQSMTKSTLYLVDLAGSERVSKSKATGSRLDEAKNINLALLALGNCIQALSDKKAKYVPFRDSKLTRLLEDSLGGNSKTSLIVTIGPSSAHVQESLSAMQFGQRAMKIENRPEKNIKVDYRALCSQLQAEIDKHNDGNNMFSIEKDQLLEEINALRAQVEKLTSEKEQMEAELEEFRKGHNDLGKFEEVKKAEIQKIQQQFKAKLDKKEAEHKKLLEQIDEVVATREEELKREKNNAVELRNKVSYLNNENKALKEELEQEKSDRQIRGAQLISENEDLKQKLLSEKNRSSELNEEKKNFERFKKEKEDFLAELNEKYKNLALQHSQETETLNKELQKFQTLNEKMKNQIQQKNVEFKESQEKSEKNWQEALKGKEKSWNDKLKELENKLNEQTLKLKQAERENSSLREDIKNEKEKFSLINSKLEKFKENYEEKIQNLENELQTQKLKENQQVEFISSLNEQLEAEKQGRKEDTSNFSHDLKASKHKNAKLLKLYKELEAKLNLKSEEIIQIQSEKSELLQSIQKLSLEKEELLKELEESNSQIQNLNKDRSKLIAKTESLSKKTSSFAKMKDKLSSEVEVKQQEFKMLLEQRDSLEEDVENLKNLLERKEKDLKNKESSFDDLKNSNSALSVELQKKESLLDVLAKKNSELEKKINAMTEKVESFKEKYKNAQGECEKSKNQLDNLNEKIKETESKNSFLVADLKQSKESCEKISKDLTKVKEELLKSTNEYEDQLTSISHQKDLLNTKHLKLLEDFKTTESLCLALKNSLKQKNADLLSIKEKCLEFEQFFKSRTKLCNESLAMLDAKSSLLSTSEDTVKYFIIKLKETIRAKDLQLEKLQNLAKKEALIQAENFSKEITSIKQSNKETIESLEEKYSQEIQELQSYYEDIIKKGNSKSEKSQEDLKNFYMTQISSINSTHSRQIEDLKATQNKVLEEIRNSLENQLEEQKEDYLSQLQTLKSQLKKSSEKYQEDLQKINDDWQSKLEQMRQADDETLTAMLKAKQKEMDMILNENKSLKMDFENTLDRQKTQSSNMKTHQLGLLEEVNRSHMQEIEALNMENSNKLKRKEAEINELKRKLKETLDGNEEFSKETLELKEINEKLKTENKKLENESKKNDFAKKNLEENLKVLNKKIEIEKGKTSDLESQNFEISEKLGLLNDEKNKLLVEIKKLTQQNKRFEEEMNQNLKTNTQTLETEIKSLKSHLGKLEIEKEVTQVLQNLLIQVEKKDNQEKILKTKALELETSKKLQQLNENSQKVLKSHKEDYSSYISHLVLEKILLVLESNDLRSQIAEMKKQRDSIKSHLSGDFSLTNYIKTSIKGSKRGANMFEFLTSFSGCYQKLQEKVSNQAIPVQMFSLSKVAHEKFMQVCRSLASKSETSKKLYEKPAIEIEKELGITGQSKSMSHQEILAKRVRDTEKNISIAVSSLMDQMILVIELQQLSPSEIRYQLESRKRKVEPLVKIDELKMLEVQIFNPPVVQDLQEIEQITTLKRLAEDLTGNLTVMSALYSYLFSRCVYLEFLLDDRSEIVALMLPNMQIQKTFKVHDFKKPFKFNKDQIEKANEFLGKTKENKVVKEEDLEEEKRKINKLMHSRAGLQLMKRHFNEIDISFTSICKKFMSSK